MKKQLLMVVMMLVMVMISTFPAMANSSDDYKVIKNAVKSKNDNGQAQFLKITVYDKKEKKNSVNITVPVALVEMLEECSKSDHMVNLSEVKDKCKDFNLNKMLEVLKKNGPMTLIEIDEEDEMIKIWFE